MVNATKKPQSNTALKYVYWILGILILFGICYVLYEVFDRQIASVLVFIGGILILYFYYVKWFIAGALNPDWPPYQTVCPDYLTPISPGYGNVAGADGKTSLQPLNGGVFKCVDFVGVSRNGQLKKADPTKLSAALASDQYSFKIDPKENAESLKSRLQAYGLTWISLFGDK